MKDDEVLERMDTYIGEKKLAFKTLIEKSKRKKQLGSSSFKLHDNIKIKKEGVRLWNRINCIMAGFSGGFCKYEIEISDFRKRGKYLHQISEYCPVK
jgi:hypothetical protein